MTDKMIWLWLSLHFGAGKKIYKKLYNHFESVNDIFECDDDDVALIPGIMDAERDKLLDKNTKEDSEKNKALTIYGYQLLVNFLWPVFFFHFQWYFFAFLWLVLLWVLVAKMILEFGEISKAAALLNIPYLLWLSFAGYLNLGVWLLN